MLLHKNHMKFLDCLLDSENKKDLYLWFKKHKLTERDNFMPLQMYFIAKFQK